MVSLYRTAFSSCRTFCGTMYLIRYDSWEQNQGNNATRISNGQYLIREEIFLTLLELLPGNKLHSENTRVVQ